MAVTGAGMKDDIERGITVSFKAYTKKPFKIKVLAEIIKQELRQ